MGHMLTVGSLFAGIGGFDLGFERNGFDVRWQAEQDGKAQAVLSARFPMARLYDDVRTIGAATVEPVDVICGGFPCQDVSVAGKREGLGGERTGLFWEAARSIDELKPKWAVLEHVPGLLSSNGGRDFHTVLSALADLGFRRAYRILDSRYFGVAQRRRRVFIVLRARRCRDGADAVLFEPQSGNWDSKAGDETRARVVATLSGRSHGAGVNMPGRGGEDDENLISATLQGNSGRNHIEDTYVTYAIGSHAGAADGGQTNRSHASGGPVGMNISEEVGYSLRAGRQQSIAYTLRDNGRNTSQGPGNYVAATLNSGGNNGGFRTEPGEHLVVPERERALAGSMHKRHDDDTDTLAAFALRADPGGTGQGHNTTYPGGVRRLTPLERERLQGFPDGWTCLCGEGHRGSSFCTCSDSPRYRQLGNAVTVNVAEWIARRILEADR